MIDLYRWLLSVFGFRWVVLTDHDGESRIALIRFRGGKPFALRWWMLGEGVNLLDGGKTSGISYVQAWEPYQPLAPKKWPKFDTTDEPSK